MENFVYSRVKKRNWQGESLCFHHMVERGSSGLLFLQHLSLSLSLSVQFENLREGFWLAGLGHAPTIVVRGREDL